MSPATGVLRFKQLRQKAYAAIWDTIMDRIEETERAGERTVTLSRFPPFTMLNMADELAAAGYDTTIEIGEYSNSVSVHIVLP